MKVLIVNADDFGMTHGINRGILAACRNGIVTSTTLLANGACFASAVASTRETPQLGVGVHLNLSDGPPVAETQQVATLLDARGQLHLSPDALWLAIACGRAAITHIETELRAQIARVIDAGILPTHLDGHMHVHVLPRVSEIVIKLAREFHIPAVRCPAESVGGFPRRFWQSGGGKLRRAFVAAGVTVLASRLRLQLRDAKLLAPARFYGIFETGSLDREAMTAILASIPDDAGISEFMCHPGYVDKDLAAVGGKLQQQREVELDALTSPEIAGVIAARGIRLVSYRKLQEPEVTTHRRN